MNRIKKIELIKYLDEYLVNVRPSWPASSEFLLAQDELLAALVEEADIHTLADATPSASDPRMLLWRGDIASTFPFIAGGA